MLRRTSPVNIWDLDIHADKHSDSFISTHTWAQITEHPIIYHLYLIHSHLLFLTTYLPLYFPNKETFTHSHTYFLSRKSHRATWTLYLSWMNTHFTNIECTAVTVSPVSSRIAACLFYSWSFTCSGRSSTFYTKNSHPSSHKFGDANRAVCNSCHILAFTAISTKFSQSPILSGIIAKTLILSSLGIIPFT